MKPKETKFTFVYNENELPRSKLRGIEGCNLYK